ncbi:MAG: hypothetical protein AUK54_05190 [Helicobacteraceae bacterium CG2_30_36_10]|nr:MAG: hypothetical protein AUK54_05190 [Helicobacteraceae bacterium CG2_30_36_10]
MKNLFYVVLITLLLGGCSYKNVSIGLDSYKADYASEISQEKKTVYLSLVKDTRMDQRTVGYAEKNGKKTLTLFSDVDFTQKYKEGLGHALNLAGFNTQTTAETAYINVEVYIKNIKIVHTNKSFDENLQGTIEIEVVVKRGNKTIKQNFVQKAGKWMKPSYTSKDLEPFLYTLFSDSINNVVSRLTRY